MYKSILVPIDGSEHSRRALEIAHRVADTDETVLYLLNVPQWPPAQDTLGRAAGARMSASRYELERAGRELLERINEAHESGHGVIEEIRQKPDLSHVRTESIVRMGAPADVILEEAERLEADAIVMGSRGISDVKALVVGSVSHKVIHTATCTVITVH